MTALFPTRHQRRAHAAALQAQRMAERPELAALAALTVEAGHLRAELAEATRRMRAAELCLYRALGTTDQQTIQRNTSKAWSVLRSRSGP